MTARREWRPVTTWTARRPRDLPDNVQYRCQARSCPRGGVIADGETITLLYDVRMAHEDFNNPEGRRYACADCAKRAAA